MHILLLNKCCVLVLCAAVIAMFRVMIERANVRAPCVVACLIADAVSCGDPIGSRTRLAWGYQLRVGAGMIIEMCKNHERRSKQQPYVTRHRPTWLMGT